MVDGEGIVVGVDMQQVADEGVVGQGDEHMLWNAKGVFDWLFSF